MVNYYVQPNGNSTSYMVTGGDQDVQDELISLQNKGVALKADRIDDRSFVFKCSKARLEKAFVRQWICKHWLDDEWCELGFTSKQVFPMLIPKAKCRQKKIRGIGLMC